jgi:hypothetical protein
MDGQMSTHPSPDSLTRCAEKIDACLLRDRQRQKSPCQPEKLP